MSGDLTTLNEQRSLQKKLSRRNFAEGILLLSAAGIVSKFCGVLYKIPLTRLLGSGGMGYFGTAYTVYALLYVFSTAGLPSAVSILTSRAKADGDPDSLDRILFVTLRFFGGAGAVLSVLTMLFARRIALFFGSDPAAQSIAAIAPAIFFSCLSGALRGWFQGQNRMAPTALSQSVEAIGKFLVGIAACKFALEKGYGIPTASAFAVFGVTFSSMASSICLLIAAGKAGFSPEKGRKAEKTARKKGTPDLLSSVLLLSLPITVGAALSGVDGAIDLFVFLRILPKYGCDAAAANALYGIFTSMAIPLYNLPSVFIAPVSSCLLPLIAAENDRQTDEELVRKALSYTFLLSIPCSVGLSVFSKPILSLFFRSEVLTGAKFLSYLAPGSLFLCLHGVQNSVLQAKKHVWLPVCAMLTGTLSKLLLIVLTPGALTVRAIPLSAVLASAVTAIFAGVTLKRVCRLKIPYLRLAFAPITCALLTVFTARAAGNCLPGGAITDLSLIFLTAIAYFLLLTLFGAVDVSELLSLFKINPKKGKSKMRIDKFLKVSRVIKRRTVANEACDNGHISVNGKTVKASYEVKVGDEVEITFGAKTLKVRVLSDKELVGKANAVSMYEVISE